MIRIERSLRQNVRLIERSRMSYNKFILDRFISISICFSVLIFFKKYRDAKQSKYHAIFTWLTNCDWSIITNYHVTELPNKFMNFEPNLNYIWTELSIEFKFGSILLIRRSSSVRFDHVIKIEPNRTWTSPNRTEPELNRTWTSEH
jgi:hypothetical protein